MTDTLLAQWKDRVLEAETEISVVQEDINAVLQQRRALKQTIRRYEDAVAQEKRELLVQLEEVEAQAKELSERCEATVRQKDAVEAIYVKTLDEYEQMHYLVHDIKADEARLASREDLETTLQHASLAWAEEEHTLRTRLRQLQGERSEQAQRQRAEVVELEGAVGQAEQRLQQARQARHTSAARATLRRGRYESSPAHTSVVHAEQTTTSSLRAHSAYPVTVNAPVSRGTASVPNATDRTRDISHDVRHSAVPLRSCLKTRSTAEATTMEEEMDALWHKTAVSAPVSRSGSQSLVERAVPYTSSHTDVEVQDAGVREFRRLALQSGAIPTRAYSYACKRPSRQRDVFADSTNL